MLSVQQAVNCLSKKQTIQLTQQGFVRPGPQYAVTRYFFRESDKRQIEKVAGFIRTKLQTTQNEEKESYLKLANHFVKRYESDFNGHKIAKIFDREIITYRKDGTYFHKSNRALHAKWCKFGMPSEIYHQYPEFCDFMEKSGCLSQMKVTKDCPQLKSGEPHLLVNGTLTPWLQIKDQFTYVDSGRYKERFIIHKLTHDVYTYLDNGKGLQPHHPYLSTNATKLLTDEELKRVMDQAKLFQRPGEVFLNADDRLALSEERKFVIQLVTSHTKGHRTNFHELLVNSRHPYLRLIVSEDVPEKGFQKGDVFDIGFGWVGKAQVPFVTTQGRFRSPDIWEYVSAEERIVTNIPVTKEEAEAFADYTLQYHKDEVNLGNSTGFHILRQNCSTYVRASLAVAGVQVPTEVSLTECIKRISPNWFASIAKVYASSKEKVRCLAKKAISTLPKGCQEKLTKVAALIEQLMLKIVGIIAALSLVPANIALGGGMGEGGAAFVMPNDKPKEIRPVLSDLRNWFKLSSYNVNLPGVLQEWQRKQASTVIYRQPVKLTVVP